MSTWSSSCLLFFLSFICCEEEYLLFSGGEEGYEDYLVGLPSVEVFSLSSGQLCSLPPLPQARWYHTMDTDRESILICGGGEDTNTCLSFISGEWVTSHTMMERATHTSWQRNKNVVLLGGLPDGSETTSEIVTMAGVQVGPAFPLQYPFMYGCSITDQEGDSVILTGGWITSMTIVSRYGPQGFLEDLPALQEGRFGHGCGAYNREGDRSQVLLVAGGMNSYFEPLSSTEVLAMTSSSSSWILATPLPRKISYPRVVTAGGTLYLTGGMGDGEVDPLYYRDEILSWLDKEQEWVEVGRMRIPRGGHAVTTIKADHPAMMFCV